MKQESSNEWTVLPVLFGIAILAYGLFIPTLGLFGDDWPHLWVYHTFGLDGFSRLVTWDRPFSAWVYWIIAPLAGENLWGYHAYLLLIRWAGAVLFYFIVKEIVQDSKPLPFWAAVFFLVYPGFRQQPQPLEFILHFTVLGLLFLSFWCMLQAFKSNKYAVLFHVPGTIAAFSIFSIEYFIGLELLRPVFLWIVSGREKSDLKSRLIKISKNWWPYVFVMAVYVYWRILVFRFPTYKPTFLSSVLIDPILSLTGLGQVLMEEIRAAVLGAWRQIISIPLETGAGSGYFVLVAVAFVLVYLWLFRSKATAEKVSPILPFVVGGLAVLMAGIPFWITGIPVQLTFPWDRSTLPFMPGVSLLLCGGLLFFRPAFRNIIASVIIALSVGLHYQNTQLYQVEWNKLSQFFWQLSWRAPSLKPGTIVISENIPLFYYGDNNLTPVLNWQYTPENRSIDIPYNFFDMGERLGRSLPDLLPGLPVEHGYRFVSFKSTSDALLPVYFTPAHCLRVLDRETAQIEDVPKRLRKAADFSTVEKQILSSPISVPPAFVPEPEHDWCFYYQKAELAVLMEEWDRAIVLWQEAATKGFVPVDKTELLPFITAKIQIGDISGAEQLSGIVLEQEGSKEVLCSFWQNQQSPKLYVSEDFLAAKQSLGCE